MHVYGHFLGQRVEVEIQPDPIPSWGLPHPARITIRDEQSLVAITLNRDHLRTLEVAIGRYLDATAAQEQAAKTGGRVVA